MRQLDFVNEPKRSRLTINDWVVHQTGGRIKDLLQKGVIDKFTRMVLTNAIYFNVAWFRPFESAWTRNGQFHLPDGSAVDVQMMKQAAWFGYATGKGYQAVELLYEGQGMSIIILLPQEGRFGEFEVSLDAEVVGQAVQLMTEQRISLTMPKFELGSEFGLTATLKDMSMSSAFNEESDFSGMDGNSCLANDDPCLSIKDVVHKAFVSVDEEGTEAAAATASVIGFTSVRRRSRLIGRSSSLSVIWGPAPCCSSVVCWIPEYSGAVIYTNPSLVGQALLLELPGSYRHNFREAGHEPLPRVR